MRGSGRFYLKFALPCTKGVMSADSLISWVWRKPGKQAILQLGQCSWRRAGWKRKVRGEDAPEPEVATSPALPAVLRKCGTASTTLAAEHQLRGFNL